MTDHSARHDETLVEVEGVIRELRNAINAGDIDRLLQIAAEDLELMPPGHFAVAGRDAHEFLRGFLGQFKADLKPFTNEEVSVAGDWAIHRLTYENVLTPKSGGEPITERGDGFHIFRRDGATGSWRLVKDISTSVVAASAEL
jgi:ketosteroid isomerase-like protein